MNRLIKITTVILLCSIKAVSQQLPFTLDDTVNMKEVVVSQTIPLNENTTLDNQKAIQFSSIDKINARLGGMSLISRGAYALEPTLNSFSAGQINVTIDGMKIFGACTDKMDPVTSYIETDNLNSIALSHGTNGSKNGSTVGGTFDMALAIPTFGETSGFKIKVGSGYESNPNAYIGQLAVNYNRKKWAYRVNGVYKKYNTYTDGNGDEVPFTQYEKINLYNSFVYTFNNGEYVKADYLIDDAYNVGYPALPMDVGKAQARIYALEYVNQNAFGNIKNLKVKVYANTIYHLMDDSHRDSIYFVENSITHNIDTVYMKMDMPGWSNTYGAYVEGSVLWGKNQQLYIKAEEYLNFSKAEMTMFMNNLSRPGEPPMYTETWPDNYRHVQGIYLQNRFISMLRFSLNVNVRFDYSTSTIISEQGKSQHTIFGYDTNHKYNYLTKTANVNVLFKISKSINMNAGAGFGERLPTQSEQFGFYLFNALDGYDYIGNPDIKTEKSINIWNRITYTSHKFKVAWENYYYHLSDYILGAHKPEINALNFYASGVKQYENIESVTVFSSNAQMLWQPFNRLETTNIIKYTFGQTYTKEPLPLIAPLKNIFSLAYKTKQYYVQTEVELSAAQNRINTNFGETKTSEYSVLNIRAGYNFNVSKAKAKLSVGMDNVFNKGYSEHLDWGNYSRPGRNVNFYLSVEM